MSLTVRDAVLAIVLVGCRRLESIEVGPADAEVPKTTSVQLAATGVYSNGAREDLSARVLWASDDPGVAAVADGGLVRGLNVGSATLSARLDDSSGSALVRVGPAPIASFTVKPSSSTLEVGHLEQLSAIVTDVEGIEVDVTSEAAWSAEGSTVVLSSDPRFAGSVKGLAPGVATAYARARGKTATAQIVVRRAAPLVADGAPCSGEEKALTELTVDRPSDVAGVTLISFKFVEESNEKRVAKRRTWSVAGADPLEGLPVVEPKESTGRCALPHYGVGGFRAFKPDGRTLQAPARLVMQYTRIDAEAIDASTLAIYRWDGAANDWAYVGGEHDPAGRTLSARVDRLALYTLAPSMPRGRIALSPHADGTTWTFTASGLRTNDDKAVADGTPYTAVSFAARVQTKPSPGGARVTVNIPSATRSAFDSPVGAFLTSDVSPDEPGLQILATAGSISFMIRYDRPQPARVVVFSHFGTAVGSFDVQ